MNINERIQQRRLQLLVHSCIYYEFDTNIVTDTKWNEWAKELVQLQEDYPKESSEVIWSEAFKDFDGSTGMDLPIKDPWVRNKAQELINNREKKKIVVKRRRLF